MKLGETQNQEIKSVFASRTEVVKTASNNASEAAPNNKIDAGSASKMGEFLNQAGQAKQQFLAKAATVLSTAAQTSGLGAEATVTKVGNQVIIDAGAGDDKIGVTQDAAGNVTVEVNSKKQTFTGKDKDNLVIKAGDGNDTITVSKDVTVRLTLEGGGDNDEIEVDEDSTTGHTIDGGDGKDDINGGVGDDYLEGGKGDDSIAGSAGKDVLSGGIGDDTLKGGDGDDVIYAGQGKDKISGEQGNNKIFAQKGDTIEKNSKGVTNTTVIVQLVGNPGATSVIVSGKDEFKERVEQDLEMMRSSPLGRRMLQSFDRASTTVTDKSGKVTKQGVTLTIVQTSDDKGAADWANRNTANPQPYLDPTTGKKGTPNNATVEYKPSYMPTYQFSDGTSVESIPSIVLFHEMAHAHDYTQGTYRESSETYSGTDTVDTGIRNSERVATGLPIDHDGKAKTAERLDPNHPADLTENSLRREMNREKRNHYAVTKKIRV